MTIFWPSGIEQTAILPSINQYHKIIEDGEIPEGEGTPGGADQLIKMNPNPADHYIEYLIPGATILSDTEITIFALDGRSLLNWKGIPKQGVLDISSVPSGIYFVTFSYGERNWVKKLIIH